MSSLFILIALIFEVWLVFEGVDGDGLCLMLDWETRLVLETLTFGLYFLEFKPEYNVLCTES